MGITTANTELKATWVPEVYQGATAAAVGFGASKLFSEKEGEEKPVIGRNEPKPLIRYVGEQNPQPAVRITDGDAQDGQTTTPSTEKPNTQVSTADKTEEGGLPGWAWALIILAILAAIGTA